MSDAAIAPVEAVQPDPDRADTARLDSAGVGNILRLLRTLFAYGKNLVGTLRQQRDPDDIPWYSFLTSIFGTTNPALITVTTIRGLLRAAALQARFANTVSLIPLPLRDWAAKQTRAWRREPGPIGPILLDICLDLGIVPDLMDPATWDELRQAITL